MPAHYLGLDDTKLALGHRVITNVPQHKSFFYFFYSSYCLYTCMDHIGGKYLAFKTDSGQLEQSSFECSDYYNKLTDL